jgi:hypothetical protein
MSATLHNMLTAAPEDLAVLFTNATLLSTV